MAREYTPESLRSALDAAAIDGRIRGWRPNEAAPWKRGGTERPFYLFVTLADGTEIDLRNMRETFAFVSGLPR
jgi:hypothetical protein